MPQALAIASDPEIRAKLEKLLTVEDLSVGAFASPQAARKHVDDNQTAVIVLDVNLLASGGEKLLADFSQAQISFFLFQPYDNVAVLLPAGLPTGTTIVSLDCPQDLVARVSAAIQARNLPDPENRPFIERRLMRVGDRRAELEEALQAKNRFLANVSHELRTPLTSIREFASLTLDEIGGPVSPEQREFLETIVGNVDHLTQIIQDLLQISEMEEEHLSLVLGPLDVHKVAHKVLTQLVAQRPDRAQVVNQISDTLPMVLGDETRIAQVLTNLVTNALKFTESDGEITLSSKLVDGSVSVQVSDTGRGIPDSELTRIFDRFYQVADPNGPSRKGTGLGLNIAKGIIESHDGKIWAESTSGKGSTFTFTLPIFSIGAWMQSGNQSDESEIAPLLISVKVLSAGHKRSPSREELESIAGSFGKVLRRKDRLVVVPGICTIFILARGRAHDANAVRDRLVQFIRGSGEIDLHLFGFEIRLEQSPVGAKPMLATNQAA
ncbi:MAG: hybrid sensor histidine kinase/response regulator [Armatimonadota bacterium]